MWFCPRPAHAGWTQPVFSVAHRCRVQRQRDRNQSGNGCSLREQGCVLSYYLLFVRERTNQQRAMYVLEVVATLESCRVPREQVVQKCKCDSPLITLILIRCHKMQVCLRPGATRNQNTSKARQDAEGTGVKHALPLHNGDTNNQSSETSGTDALIIKGSEVQCQQP